MTANNDETRYTAGAKDAGLTETEILNIADRFAQTVDQMNSDYREFLMDAGNIVAFARALLSAQAEVKQADDAKVHFIESSVHICNEYDRECGSHQMNWCRDCPKLGKYAAFQAQGAKQT